jgi:3-methyladenine DNA glycosylase Mpg
VPPALFLLDDGVTPDVIVATPRIGVDYAGPWRDEPLRFVVGSPHLSRPVPRSVR